MDQENELSTQAVMTLFNKSYMTVWNWRMGRSDKKPLPYHTKPRGTREGVYFNRDEVIKWAADNGVRLATGEVPSLPVRTRTRTQLAPQTHVQ